LGPIPNPQSPIPNPQSPHQNKITFLNILFLFIYFYLNYLEENKTDKNVGQ